VSLRAAHPGVMLVVEVGYKMRLFGEDAEVAARVSTTASILLAPSCSVASTCHQQHMCPWHVYRLCCEVCSSKKGSIVTAACNACMLKERLNKRRNNRAPASRGLLVLLMLPPGQAVALI